MWPGQKLFKQVKKIFPIIHPLLNIKQCTSNSIRDSNSKSGSARSLFLSSTERLFFRPAISANVYKKYCRLFGEATAAAFVTPPIQPPGIGRCGPDFAQNRMFNKTARNSARLMRLSKNPVISEFVRAPC